MRILIRDKRHQLYVSDDSRWVKDANTAHDFESMVTAIDCLTTQRLRGVELVCTFPNPNYNFSIPVEAHQETT
jgi:hypothetical protein